MDIFSKIDEQSEQQQAQEQEQILFANIVEKNGKYGYNFVADPSKQDDAYKFYEPSTCHAKTGYFVEKRTKKLYKILTTPVKQTKTQKQYEKQLKARKKKVEKLLKKGVNFLMYFSVGMQRDVLMEASFDELKILYDNGFAIQSTLVNIYDSTKVFSKNIYFGVYDFDVNILQHIPTSILETIIHTRENLKLGPITAGRFALGFLYDVSERSINNTQLLIKTGQIFLDPKDILYFCHLAEKNGCTLIPELVVLKKFAETIEAKESSSADGKKYSTQKQIESKTEAEKTIDKLFEDAQNSTE